MTIQFRRRGGKIEILRASYDPERKRGVAKSLGRMSAYAAEIPAAVRALLDDEESVAVDRWEREAKAASAASGARMTVHSFSTQCQDFASAIDAGAQPFGGDRGDYLARTRKALIAASEALRRAERRHAAATKKAAPAPAQSSGVVELRAVG